MDIFLCVCLLSAYIQVVKRVLFRLMYACTQHSRASFIHQVQLSLCQRTTPLKIEFLWFLRREARSKQSATTGLFNSLCMRHHKTTSQGTDCVLLTGLLICLNAACPLDSLRAARDSFPLHPPPPPPPTGVLYFISRSNELLESFPIVRGM